MFGCHTCSVTHVDHLEGWLSIDWFATIDLHPRANGDKYGDIQIR